jgi:hypothetical protein
MKAKLLLALLLAVPCLAQTTQTAPTPEQGTFILHKFAKVNGKETYSITPKDGHVVLTSDFLFTDRGTPVPLKTTYIAAPNQQPFSLTLDGKSSRISSVKDTFTYDPKTGTIVLQRSGKNSAYPAPANTFLIDGYSPVAMQQQMMRFWLARNRPAELFTPPSGPVRILPSGDLTVTLNNAPTTLHGYVVTGLIWGGETLWLDDHQQLIALVSTDAEFDHFEAVRDTYEPALATFIQAAAKNQLDALAQLTAKAKQPAAHLLAITNVTLIDGTGAAPLPNATVLIEDGRIQQIAAHGKAIDTSGATILDGTGKFLIPGLWDMHAHYEQVEWGPIYLAAGATTVRDCGNEFDYITTVRNTLASGRGIGPRILVAGIVDGSGPMAVGAITAETPEEALAVVRRYKAAGALQIKIYSSMKPELVPVITAEAHRLGMTVTGHVPNGMNAVQAVEAGYDQINHIQYPLRQLLPPLDKKQPIPVVDLTTPDAQHAFDVFKQHHTVFDPTMSLYEMQYHPASVPAASFEPGVTHVAPQLAAALDSPGLSPEQLQQRLGNLYPDMITVLRKLHEDGQPIVAGTDQNIPGYSLHRELEIYVDQAGFTPMEALQSATIVPARAMGLDKELGTIEPGKHADLVLLDADPLADIHNTRRIFKTISGGAVYDPAPLWQVVDFKP